MGGNFCLRGVVVRSKLFPCFTMQLAGIAQARCPISSSDNPNLAFNGQHPISETLIHPIPKSRRAEGPRSHAHTYRVSLRSLDELSTQSQPILVAAPSIPAAGPPNLQSRMGLDFSQLLLSAAVAG